MATIPYLKNRLKGILAHRKGAARAALNVFPHFLALDEELLYKMMRQSFKDGDIGERDMLTVMTLLREYIVLYTGGRTIHSVGNRLRFDSPTSKKSLKHEDVASRARGFVPAMVLQNGKLKGVLDSSFSNLREGIFKDFLNSKKISKYLGEGKKFQVGHTEVYDNYNSANSEVRYAQTASGSQVNKYLDALRKAASSDRYSSDKIEVLGEILNNAINVRDAFEVHAEYGRTLEVNLDKNFREGLLSVRANIVLIQDKDENESWGKDEHAFITEVRKTLHLLHFSRNAVQEIGSQVSKALSGKKIHSSKSSAKIVESMQAVIGKIVQDKISLPKLRNNKGQFLSLTNLKNMINLQLMEQVTNNMGKGNAKSILNWRTGRFAASAHVEHLARNKDNSITAYYTYLKYPYATFEPGNRQGQPTTRDPRLLISKSIRQLAAQQMAERLKTVCV